MTRKSKKRRFEKNRSRRFKIALLCGGPSLERGISLNSARSVCDHLQSAGIEIVPVYFDHRKSAYQISQAQLYSNTPSDFDFKLHTTARPLSTAGLHQLLSKVDLVFPAMHGPFGEDGGVQRLLERGGYPFVGTGSAACQIAFDKHRANEFIAKNNFFTIPSLALERGERGQRKKIAQFFKAAKIKRAIVKPATGGSSIAVYSVSTIDEAMAKAAVIFSERVDRRVVVEPFCEGREFTVILLENDLGMPVAVLPTEIELDYRDHQIFDYRKKYLATRQVTYHCPPRFSDDQLERIQVQAEQLYRIFGMRDFARFDGWLFPDGQIWFSDFNPISGMEQNSFLFMQGARLGLSHRAVLLYVVRSACRRYQLSLPEELQENTAQETAKNTEKNTEKKKTVHVLFGGKTAERQVSLMSGTNVWLKLRRSTKFTPEPYLLDLEHNVWHLPYAYALNHTVEEIIAMCQNAAQHEARLEKLRAKVLARLRIEPRDLSELPQLPERMSLAEFIRRSPRVFIALHGGFGEDGSLQKLLEEAKVPFNGCGSQASRLCIDKVLTGEIVSSCPDEGLLTARRRRVPLRLFQEARLSDYRDYFKDLASELGSETVLVKPVADGCSAGIARLRCGEDLREYLRYARGGAAQIPPGTLSNQLGIVEMPTHPMKSVLFEEFVITDSVVINQNKLIWEKRSGWIEITVGLLEYRGKLRALNPSITVARGDVLSLEEKFQGGTGVNITPPPEAFVSKSVRNIAKAHIERVGRALSIEGYARIDAFLNIKSGEVLVIEANSLPGLTPSTVFYHQALTEQPPIFPVALIETILVHAENRYHGLAVRSRSKVVPIRRGLQGKGVR